MTRPDAMTKRVAESQRWMRGIAFLPWAILASSLMTGLPAPAHAASVDEEIAYFVSEPCLNEVVKKTTGREDGALALLKSRDPAVMKVIGNIANDIRAQAKGKDLNGRMAIYNSNKLRCIKELGG